MLQTIVPTDYDESAQVADLLAGPDDVLESYEPPVLPPQYALPEPNFGATPEVRHCQTTSDYSENL